MNESGIPLQLVSQYFKIKPQNILVAHDELALPVGTNRLKTSGGTAGHNGLRSIVQHLNTNNFNRLRIGIDHPQQQQLVTPYVLGKPNKSDYDKIIQSLENLLFDLDDILAGDFEKAMNSIHKKD